MTARWAVRAALTDERRARRWKSLKQVWAAAQRSLTALSIPFLPQLPSPGKHKKPLSKSGFLHHHKVTKWRRHPDSNWRVKLLQSFALPLGHGADMER